MLLEVKAKIKVERNCPSGLHQRILRRNQYPVKSRSFSGLRRFRFGVSILNSKLGFLFRVADGSKP